MPELETTPTTPNTTPASPTEPVAPQQAELTTPADGAPSALTTAPPREPEVEVKPVTFDELKVPPSIKADAVAPMLDVMNNKELSPSGRTQALLDLYQEEAKKILASPAAAYKAQNDKWREAMKADPEIGGDRLYSQVIPAAMRMITQFGGPEYRKALDLTGMGNHPEQARFLFKVAQALGEGSHVSGNPISQAPKRPTAAEALYPSLVKGNE